MSQTINSSGIYPHTGPGAGDLRINKAGFQTPNITNGTVPGGSVPILSVTADGLEKQHQTSQPPALLRLRPVTTPPIGGAAKLSQVRILNCQSKEMLKYLRCPLCQRSPTFLAPGTGFVGDKCSTDPGEMVWDDSSTFIVPSISIVITPAPSQLSRHSILEAGDSCSMQTRSQLVHSLFIKR